MLPSAIAVCAACAPRRRRNRSAVAGWLRLRLALLALGVAVLAHFLSIFLPLISIQQSAQIGSGAHSISISPAGLCLDHSLQPSPRRPATSLRLGHPLASPPSPPDMIDFIVTLLLASTIMVGLMGLGVALTMPFHGALIRLRANYNPKAIGLEGAENRWVRRLPTSHRIASHRTSRHACSPCIGSGC